MPLEEPLFSELIQRLDGERGMRRKVSLLVGSWSLLRKLSPEQRESVALAVGNRWAWRNIESLFGHAGELSNSQRQVKDFFDSMGRTDPGKLQEVSSEIRQEGFRAAAKHVLGAVEEVLGDDEPRLDQEPVDPVGGETEVGASPAQEREGAVDVQQEVPSDIEVRPGEPEPLEPPPKKPAERLTVEPPVAELEPDPEPKPLESEPQGPAVEPAPEEDQPFEYRQQDVVALSAIESLRALRRLANGQVSPTRSGRAAMIDSLASGWAARRALTSIIRSHSVADLDEALALIRRLPGATQQTWCLGDLIQYWNLDEGGRRRVLAAAPTEADRRRLKGRTRRAV